MSKRLLQRGRYPKGPGVDQFPNSTPQFSQTTPAQQPVASDVNFFSPSQPPQNSWNHPPYPNSSTYQQNKVPPPVSESNAYWSPGQMYPMQMQQPNDPWNWPAENSSENTSYPSYQQQQPQQPSYQQQQQPNFHHQQQQQPNYPQPGYPLQSNFQQQPSSQQQQLEQPSYAQLPKQPNYTQQEQPIFMQQQEQSNLPQQQLNYLQQPLGPPPSTDTWPHISQPQAENQNFVSQPVSYDSSIQQIYEPPATQQPLNNNSNSVALDTSLQSWENSTLSITQPAQLPWTYSSPQYCNPPSNLSTEFPPNVSLNYNSLPKSETEISNQPPSDCQSNDNETNGAVKQESNALQNSTVEESVDSVVSNPVPSSENVSASSRDITLDAEYGTSSLSAFFQSSVQNDAANSECGGTSSPELKNIVDTASIIGDLSQSQINESERSSNVTEDEQDDRNLEDTDDGGNQEVNFIQEEENIAENILQSDSAISFAEEPVNQEVPEPNMHISANSSQSVQLNQDYHEMSPEEPLNQQIPAESGQKSRSTSSERERVVIRPREESPFKPPRTNSNSKATIVQQEISVQSVKESKHPEEKTVVQEVNLETFPDNLERPPDYEELKKQSSFYASHQKHLRTELNSSPSSLLCDNLDIPCVTLAPAAPPILSSAKSDKSESSSDSKREMNSFDSSANSKNVAKESSSSSPAGLDPEFNSRSLNVNKSNSARDVSERKLPQSASNKIYNSSQDLRSEPNDQHPSQLYLKDSKISDVRNSDPYRKSVPAAENMQNPSISQGYSSAHSDYSLSKAKASNSRYPPEVNRQKFADRKYPSFDERQYYSDRERSRPPSRSSLDDRSDDYRYPPKPGDYYPPHDDRRRGPPDYPRPPSRMSESDLRPDRHGQYDYYKQPYPYNSNYPRNQDYYQRPPNYRAYEYDQYQRDPYYDYYNAYRYAYSNYNYGFYDELYRNDPRYRQYQEQMKQYYGKYGYEGEYDRSSAHSGRSSANELSKDMNSTRYLETDMDSNASEISAYNIQQDYSYADIPNEVSVSAVDNSSTPSQRLTPVKFSYSHPIVCFSAGGLLITAVPSQVDPTIAAPVRIQNMQTIMENEDSYQELKNYQGPLIRGLTHKNDVVEFCNQKIKLLRKKDDVVDRDSYILLWELMILLLRQNGSVAGSDIAELLLKDHEVLRPPTVLRHNIETPQGEHSPAEVNDSSSQSHAGDTSSPDEGIVVLHDKTSLNVPKTVDVDKVTRKFREFLLFGHKKDALEWAMKHGLWGHALFLASKMDLRTYANVMTRFANSLALNDPLQTLYQLMSGRQPSAVTCVADKKWGDWRPHLAMILSNPSGLTEVDSRSITTLGDTLASRGCLPAAQFCYIMAQVDFGAFEQKNSKLVLLSADHRLPFEEFATNEAIQCTEIYEYAQSLANPGYLLTHLQMYKFLYALRLVEHGFLEEALHYCEVIAGNLLAHSLLFSYDLISEVFKLASRLKYHDPHFLRGQGEYEDQDDPEWLKKLANLVTNYNNVIQGRNSEINYEQQQQQLQLQQQQQQLDQLQTVSEQPLPTTENIGYQNLTTPSTQTEMTNSVNNMGFYQQNWNEQNTILPNSTNLSNNQQEIHSYYQNDINNQSNFHVESSVPSHEENETTDVPSSPVTQTPPFDYYSGSTQQEWSSVHSLPSVSLSDVGTCHSHLKSDLESLVKKEDTESDVALCSSAHSTPLHNYLLSKDDSDDRQMLMNRSRNAGEPLALNSCLKSKHSLSNKGKKCIKFDASVSGHTGKLQRTGIRRRKFSKKKSELTSQSDSSPEGSPSKEKSKSKLSLLATLGIIRSDNGSLKLTKRKRKAKKKNVTIEKLMQSKKTFAIDEPCDAVEMQKEKTIEDSVQDTKKIIGILKKISDDKNSELSQLMANEFNKKPPLIFGGTYPIDEPFESKKSHPYLKNYKISRPDEFFNDSSKLNLETGKKSKSVHSGKLSKSDSRTESCGEHFTKTHYSEDLLVKMSPLRMFKRMQTSARNSKLVKEKPQNSVDSTHSSNTPILKAGTNFSDLIVSDSKQSHYDQVSNYHISNTRRERRDSALSSSSRYSGGNSTLSHKPSIKETSKPEAKSETKPASQAGKTWLGGIFSRLLPKGPNQMILPDDKNPTIVWDEVKKRWVNKDGNDDDETNAPLAPPTDMELMGSKSSDIPTVPQGTSGPPVATSPVNKFQRPKTRGMRQNYVDILSNSGATSRTNVPPEALFPAPLEQPATSSSNMFIPPTVSSVRENSSELDTVDPSATSSSIEQQNQPQAVSSPPLMFDPAEFESRRSNISSQRHVIGRTGRRTYPT